MNTKSIINVEKIHNELEVKRLNCKNADDYAILNAEITKINNELYNSAVEVVANSDNIIVMLLSEPAVSQFAFVADNGESVQLKNTLKIVEYSAVANYIKKHNKQVEKNEIKAEPIKLPFTNADFVLFNLYGHNLSKEILSSLELNSLKKLAEFNSKLDCFKASSNTKLKEQLNVLFVRLEEVAGVNLDIKAIERNSKLISMDFIKYKRQKHTINIAKVDKLIDFIICQYIINRDKKGITVKSALDIHKKKDNN